MPYVSQIRPTAARRAGRNLPPPHLEHLEDAALVARLLGISGTSGGLLRARALLDFAGGLEGLAKLGPSLLAQQAGIGELRAERVVAAFELGSRRLRAEARGTRIDSLDAVVTWAVPRLLPLDHEEMWVLSLDGRNGLCSARRAGQGGLHGCALSARDILRPALRDGASAIVLVHNHPSGDPAPSPEDCSMTEQVVSACSTIGTPLLDHVIVARGGSTSLLALGIVP